ncbi:MAG TPA: general stress protein [Burkholderiaceae bacterium]|nr:general stress protein [Burkholderiaceae bacterium]
MAKTIVGSFDSFEEAQEVVRDLQQRGFSRDDISVIANNATGKYSSESAGVQAMGDRSNVSETGANTATGAAAGGVLGGAAGLVVGLMGLAIPGIGPIVAAGPIAAALAGAGVGAVAGGLIGGLTGVGVPEDDASYYAESVRRGGALVTVRADDARADEAASLMRSQGAVDIERRAEQWKQQGWTGHDPSATPYTVDQLERERSSYGSLGQTSGQNMGVGSQMGANTTTSGMGVTSTSSTWSDDEDFRTHYSDYLSSSGGAYEDYEPAYRYGSDLGRNERYRGRDWSEIESDARRDWESRNPNDGWERFKAAIRRGWERTSDAVERAMPGDSDRDGR